jgi:putative addiction module component (TIGR02574 family)
MAYMNARARKIIDEALALPADERALVVAELQESLGSNSAEDVQAAWDDELVRRAEAIVGGKAESVDGEHVAQRVRAMFGR